MTDREGIEICPPRDILATFTYMTPESVSGAGGVRRRLMLTGCEHTLGLGERPLGVTNLAEHLLAASPNLRQVVATLACDFAQAAF